MSKSWDRSLAAGGNPSPESWTYYVRVNDGETVTQASHALFGVRS